MFEETPEEEYEWRVDELLETHDAQAAEHNALRRCLLQARIAYREHALRRVGKIVEYRVNMLPLWQSPSDFVLRSAEATLYLPSKEPPMTGREIAEFVTNGLLPDRLRKDGE
jgi:hypothetical protein